MIRGIPLALLALTLGAFAIGTTEFVIVGLIPTIAADLQVSLPSAGLLVSLYALGVAIGAPVLTALTGRVPRKSLLVALMVLFTLGNVIAFLAPGYTSLIVARILTGLAHGVFFSIGSIIATAVVPKEKAASAIAIMFTGLTVALVTGVPLGTFIGQHLGWRATMVALSVVGAASWLLVWLRFQESVQHFNPHALQPRRLLGSWREILRHPTFLAYSATTTSSYGGLVVFLTAAPFVFTQALGWSASHVGWLLAANGVIYIGGTMLCRRLLPRWGVRNTVAIAGGLAVLCAALLLGLALLEVRTPWAYACACLLFPIAHGIQQPCGQSGAVSAFPKAAGMASALNGFIMMLFAFATGQLLGRSFNGTVYPLVFGLGFWCLAAALASCTLVRRHGVPSAP